MLLDKCDILAFRPEVVPVGEDQIPHLEMTRELARRFDQLYCGVNPHTEDEDYLQRWLFPLSNPNLDGGTFSGHWRS